MDIKRVQSEDRLILFLDGRLDVITSPRLDAELKRSLPTINKLVLDFSSLSYISSAGIRVILSTQKQLSSQDKKFCLRHVSEPIMDVLEMTGITDTITIE